MLRRIASAMLVLALSAAAPAWAASQEVDPELRRFLIETIDAADSFRDRFDAEVWLLAMSSRLERFLPDPRERISLLKAVHREATAAGLQPDLVLAVIEVESAFDRFAVSSAGAQGLMQVMPFWREEIGRPQDNLTDVDTNLRYGCRILQYYLELERGNVTRALARYNGSLGQYWYPERVMVAWERRWLAGAL
jgi:soluble lytic murein transglycosylase-like protein